MPDKQQIVLSEDQIAEIEARDWHLNGALEKRIALSPAERDALCHTVRALRAENERLRELVRHMQFPPGD